MYEHGTYDYVLVLGMPTLYGSTSIRQATDVLFWKAAVSWIQLTINMSFFWKQEFTSPMRITTTLWTRPMKNTVIIAQWCGWELHLHLQKVLWCILVAGDLTSSTVFHKQSKSMWPLKDLSGRKLQLHSIKLQACISLFILQQHNWSSKPLASSYCKPPTSHPHTYIQVGSHFLVRF